jgi:hypothetical protein
MIKKLLLSFTVVSLFIATSAFAQTENSPEPVTATAPTTDTTEEAPPPGAPKAWKKWNLTVAYLQTINLGSDENNRVRPYQAEAIFYTSKTALGEGLMIKPYLAAVAGGLDIGSADDKKPGAWWLAGVDGGYLTNYMTMTLYHKGRHVDEWTYFTSYLGLRTWFGYNPAKKARVYAQLNLRRLYFKNKPQTDDNFILPTNTYWFRSRLNLELGRIDWAENMEIGTGYRLKIFGEMEMRDRWKDYSLSTTDEGNEVRFVPGAYLVAQAYWLLPYHLNLQVDVKGRYSENTDYISTSKLGSQLGFGDDFFFIGGAAWAEYRSGKLAIINSKLGFDLWESARGHLMFDQAVFEEWLPMQENKYYKPIIGVTGIGIGIRQGLWRGLPVWLRYAYCPQAGNYRGGHEIFFMIAIAIMK